MCMSCKILVYFTFLVYKPTHWNEVNLLLFYSLVNCRWSGMSFMVKPWRKRWKVIVMKVSLCGWMLFTIFLLYIINYTISYCNLQKSFGLNFVQILLVLSCVYLVLICTNFMYVKLIDSSTKSYFAGQL